MRKKGLFITFEGGEGAGKSTQIKRAASFLKRSGKKVKIFREPGSTVIGEAIRDVILLPKHKKMFPHTELLLYFAARSQLIREKIKPAIESGYSVICDRYEDSTFAYQGFGRGFSLTEIQKFSSFVRESFSPNMTFILDLPVDQGLKRGGRYDRMEKESMTFHSKVRKGFLSLAKKHPRRIQVINARLSIKEISNMINERISRALNR